MENKPEEFQRPRTVEDLIERSRRDADFLAHLDRQDYDFAPETPKAAQV